MVSVLLSVPVERVPNGSTSGSFRRIPFLNSMELKKVFDGYTQGYCPKFRIELVYTDSAGLGVFFQTVSGKWCDGKGTHRTS